MSVIRTMVGGGSWLAVILLIAAASAAEGDLQVDNVMDQDPAIVLPGTNYRFSKELKPLWFKALARPDAEIRRLAADTFTLAASRKMPDLQDAVDPLLKIATTDSDPVVRRAAARAIVALDGRQTAAELRKLAEQDGLLMAQIVEPALARWKFAAVYDTWRARLEQPDVERAALWLAIRGLAQACDDDDAVARLLKIVRDENRPAELRTAAAQGVGEMRDRGMVELADELCAKKYRLDYLGRLLAVSLLVRHSDDRALETLRRLAKDVEPTVAAAAIERLWAIDRSHALPFAGGALTHADAKLRRTGAAILCEQGDVAAIQLLGPALNDRNPGVRRLVAARFVAFAEKDETLKAVVLEQSVAMLAGEQWRGLEQAALVLGKLDHKPAADRLVQLLPFARGEVRIAVAWALRRLKVPATFPLILAHAHQVDKALAMNPPDRDHGLQQSQIFQLFGEVRYREAEALLRKYVPKSLILVETRGAACWALGHLYVDNPNTDLVDLFVERLSDVVSPMPELAYVRQMTAIGLGRMRAERTLPVLRKFAAVDGPATNTGFACFWSIERMTGEKMPVAPERENGVPGWFLEPFGAK